MMQLLHGGGADASEKSSKFGLTNKLDAVLGYCFALDCLQAVKTVVCCRAAPA